MFAYLIQVSDVIRNSLTESTESNIPIKLQLTQTSEQLKHQNLVMKAPNERPVFQEGIFDLMKGPLVTLAILDMKNCKKI